jgi:hypothetical protein
MDADKIVQFPSTALSKDSWVDALTKHWKTILLSAVGMAVLLFVMVQVSSRFQKPSQSDYVAATSLFNDWLSLPNPDKKNFERLEKILDQHPELQAKFGGLIAERLMQLHENDAAAKYAEKALQRTKDGSSHYHQFALATCAIAKGQLKEALSSSIALKKAMEEDLSFWQKPEDIVKSGSLIYAFNLLRIAILEKEAGTPEAELQAWEDFEKHASFAAGPIPVKMDQNEAYSLIFQNFREQGITLNDFISYRKGILAKH